MTMKNCMNCKSYFNRLILTLIVLMGFNGNIQAQFSFPGFEHLTLEQGLSDNNVSGLLFDHEGYLWAATKNGLNRYDGYQFTTYLFDPRDDSSINRNIIRSLFQDSEGIIWVGTNGSGISKFDRLTEKFINFIPQQSKSTSKSVLMPIVSINEDREGMLWVGCGVGGELSRFNKRTGQYTSYEQALGYRYVPDDPGSFNVIICIYKDKTGDLWIGDRAGLHKLVLKPGKNKAEPEISFQHFQNNPDDTNSLAGKYVRSIFEDHEGNLWILTEAGLNRMDKKKRTFIHYFHDPLNNSSFTSGSNGEINEDTKGNLLIGTFHGLDILNKSRDRFEHVSNNYNDPASISMNTMNRSRIVIDKEGNIWIGNNGINKLDHRQIPIQRYTRDSAAMRKLSGGIANLYVDAAGTMWFGTTAGLDAIDKKTLKVRHYLHNARDPLSISEGMITGIQENKEGNLWVVTYSGDLDLLNSKTGKFIHYTGKRGIYKNLGGTESVSLFRDSRGLLWIPSSGRLTSINESTGEIMYYFHDPKNPKGLSDEDTNCIGEDRNGNIWIGHKSDYTDRLNPKTGKINHYRYSARDSNSISAYGINVICKDSKGDLWLGTDGGGLCKYNDSLDQFTKYTEKDGLASNYIYTMNEDNKMNLWLGTSKGVCRFSPDSKSFSSFSHLGNPNRATFRIIYCKDKDGKLYMDGEINGAEDIISFDPGKLQPYKYIPPIIISRFYLFNEPKPGLNEAKEIVLAHNQNFFSFEFSALNFTNPEKNQYAYQLEGVDKDWVYSGSRRTAQYTSVSPGTYIFRVKGSNDEGVWNETGTSIRIVIHPPWWGSWWAYSFYALCLIAAVWMIDRSRKTRLIRRERERGQQRELEMQALRAQMNPHFIFNCLSSINNFVLKNQTEAASDYLTKFSRLIRTVLNNSKKPLIPLEDELDMLKLYLDMESLRFTGRFEYSINIDKDIDPTAVFMPPLLLQPIAENAIWHGLMHKKESGRLVINIQVENNILTCVIADNGVGRSYTTTLQSKSVKKGKSMGIQITRQRLALINGDDVHDEHAFKTVDLYDDNGKAAGTRVSLNMKLVETINEK
jgi:ligand-binding sensor domain-containing protein